MNVLFASGIYPPDIGGPATYVRQLARALHERGAGVEVVAYGEAAADADPFVVERVRRDRLLPARYAALARAVRSAARRADVVFAQDSLSTGLPAALGARLAGRPLLLKIVGDLAWEISDELGWIPDGVDAFQAKRYGPRVEALRAVQRRVAQRGARVIVPSEYVRGIVSGWGVDGARVELVPNGVPPLVTPALPREAARAELGVAARFVISSVGRLIPLKRFELLIAALAQVRAAVPEACLVVVGSGPAESALRARAVESGVADRVVFTGRLPRPEVLRYLRASDVFALVSTHEGSSHVLLEAMQAGAAVLATDVGGNRETLDGGRAGRLLASAAPDAIAAAIVELHAAPAERARLREAGERRARESWPAMIERTIAVLERTRAEARA